MEEQKIEVTSISKVLETKRQLDIDSVPMEVEKKNVGYYENLPSHLIVQEKKPETVESLQLIEPSSGRSPQPISETQQKEIELIKVVRPKNKGRGRKII
uniref:Uncharacterized protein n=1 Tax=Meloidogyne enterolobii TaxID=390850 RepID=A0A6V7UK86_MELEN|nr:unnamed protein product [Meloidogyne enterolobii]